MAQEQATIEQRRVEFELNCDNGKGTQVLFVSNNYYNVKLGDPGACHNYAQSLSVMDNNFKEAFNHFERNCNALNFTASCYNLGRYYLPGEDKDAASARIVTPDATKALACFGN